MVFLNWKREAIENLKDYSAKKTSIQNIADEIGELNSKKASIRSATADGTAAKGGGSVREDVMLDNIIRAEKLSDNLRDVRRWVSRVDTGLSALDDEERLLLDRFYINPERGAADTLAFELSVDIKTVYHRKDRALRKFTVAMYGCVES